MTESEYLARIEELEREVAALNALLELERQGQEEKQDTIDRCIRELRGWSNAG